jgi:ATP-binding cassette subfamily B protein
VAAEAPRGATGVTIAEPLLLRYAIDEGVRKDDLGPVNTAALIYLGLALLRPLFERVIVLSSARAGERFLGDLRVAAYDHLQRLSMPFFESERAGVLVSPTADPVVDDVLRQCSSRSSEHAPARRDADDS